MRLAVRVQQLFDFLRSEIKNIDGARHGKLQAAADKEGVFAIGQKIRETIGAGFIAIDGGDLGGRAARSGNREQAGLIGRSKENDAGSIPGAAAAGGGVGDYRDGAAGNVDAFEFLVGEKAEGAAVGGPER